MKCRKWLLVALAALALGVGIHQGLRWYAREHLLGSLAARMLPQEEHLKCLEAQLNDEDAEVRARAARAIGCFPLMDSSLASASAVPALIEAARDDGHNSVRAAAAIALGKVGGPPAVRPLIERLSDQDPRVRSAAAYALETSRQLFGSRLYGVGDGAAVPALVDCLEDRDTGVRHEAATALGNIGDASAVPALVEHLCEEREAMTVRCVAAEALRRIGDPVAVPTLIECLSDGDGYVRGSAAKALGLLADPSAVSALEELLDDEWVGARVQAERAIDRIRAAQNGD